MEITETHIRQLYKKLENFALGNYENDKDFCRGILFAAGAMHSNLKNVLKAKFDEDLNDDKDDALKLFKGIENKSGKKFSEGNNISYRCGHDILPIIINTSVQSLSIYIAWKKSGSDLCLNCWLKDNEDKVNEDRK